MGSKKGCRVFHCVFYFTNKKVLFRRKKIQGVVVVLVARQESVSVLSYWAPSYTWELSAEQREARDWVGSQRGRATLTSSFPTLREEEVPEVTWRLTNLTPARPQQASRVDLPSRSPQSVLVERLEFCWSGETVRLPARTCHTTIRFKDFLLLATLTL